MSFKIYIINFCKEDSGIETIEQIGLLGIAAGLVAVIVSIIKGFQEPTDQAVKQMSKAVDKFSSLTH